MERAYLRKWHSGAISLPPARHQKGRGSKGLDIEFPAGRQSIMSLEEAITECVHDMLVEAKRKGVLGDTTMRQVKDHMKEEMGEVRQRQPHPCPTLLFEGDLVDRWEPPSASRQS